MYGFEKLRVWNKAMEFCERIYEITKSFPQEELYGITSQLRRASYSIPLNISEGSASVSMKEFKYFLNIAKRSQYEVVTLLILSYKLGYLAEKDYKLLRNKCDEIGMLLNALINSLSPKKSKNQKLTTDNGELST